MNSDTYLQWCDVPNTVNCRLKDNSLFHTLTREKRIRKSTKLINQTFERKFGKKTYAQFRQCKQKILEQLTENIDVIDKSAFTDNYYKSYYDSFDTSISNLHTDDFLWAAVDKKGRDQDEPQDSSEEPFYFWEPDININVIKTNKDFEIRKQVQTKENKNSTKKEATPKNLVKSKNITINSTSISNKEANSVDSKVTLRKSAVKQSLKSKRITNKRSKDVKKNLTTALDNVSLRSQEFVGDEWNDDFAAAEFQAQSTQIFSDTFTDKKAKRKPSIDHKLSHEVTNQPRDSGIEEDSREDNTKFENPINGKKCNKNGEHEKNNESETFKENNMNNLKDDNNLYQDEVKKSPCKKVPLKIIGENPVNGKKCNKNGEHEKINVSETFKENNMNNLKDDNNLYQDEVKKSPCKKVPLKIIGENPVNGKKCNKNGEHEKINVSETFKENNMNNLKDNNNLYQDEVKKSPCKKVPLKIIGEEKVIQKFKIITNKDQDLKPAEEEKEVNLSKTEQSGSSGIKVNPRNDKSGSSSESDSEFADCHNADNSQWNKSYQDSSDEYYDLQDNGSEGDSEDSQNENDLQNDGKEGDSEESQNENKIENDLQNDSKEGDSEDSQKENKIQNDLQNDSKEGDSEDSQNENKIQNDLQNDSKEGDSENSQNENKIENDLQNDDRDADSEDSQNKHENEKSESDNSSTDDSIIRKRKLKESLKRCKSPFMIMRYNQLKKSGVLEESDVEPQTKLIKNSEKKPKKTLITPTKSSKTKKISQLKAARLLDTPKIQKQVNNNESFEEKTLVAENFNDDSVLIKESKENVEDIEDNMEEATPNVAKLQQRKRLNLLANNDESEDSERENAHSKAKDKTKRKKNSKSSNSKHCHEKMKRSHPLNSSQDSDESESGSKNNEANKRTCNSNTSGTKIEKTDSSKIKNVQNLSKSKKGNSDSTVSESTNSQSSESEECNKKKDKIQMHKRLADTEISSAREVSVEISTQSDLKNVVNHYKQTLLSQTSQLSEDLNESNEPSTIIGTQFQPTERLDYEESDDSENSEVEKTVIKVKNQSEIQEQNRISDSEKKDDSLKNESHTMNKIKQKAKTVRESSSEEDDSDLEEMRIDFNTNVNKNEDCEDELIMSSKSKENLNKIKRLDLLNSDEDSDDSQDEIVEKSHCNSDVDIEKHKTESIPSCDDSQKKVSLNQLKSSDCDSSDKSEYELPSVCKTNKSKSKPLSSKSTNLKDSGAVPDIDDKSSSSSKNKSPRKRKFTQVDSADVNDRESVTSQEIDVVHYSSENDVNDYKKIKKSKSSNFCANALAEEENIDKLSENSFEHTKPNTVLSENESDGSSSDQAMSYSSKQKIMRLKKINLLANNSSSSSSSSEDEETIESSQNKLQKDHKKGAASKNSAFNDPDSDSSDSNSDSEKKKDLHKFDAKVNKKQNQLKENEELFEENDNSSVKEQKDDIFDEKNSKCEDSEEECTMSSKTKERLNKMKRLDLLNSDQDSDDSQESSEFKNDCNSDVDIEEHKIEDVVTQHDLKKNNETLENQISTNDSDSGKNESAKSKTKTKNSIKEKLINGKAKNNEITSNKSSKLTSTLVPKDATDGTEGENSFEKEKNGCKKSKNSKKKEIIQETQESAHSQENILESQPMFSSLEDLRDGIDEKQLNFEVDSDVNANSIKDASKISSTQAPTKMFTDKITKVSELVEKESLEKITCQSTMNVNSISPDEDIFVLEVPKTIFKENLVGKKFSFLKSTLTVGSNHYEAFQKKVSPTYSCILKTEKKAPDSFTTQNIRPVATIIARRKKLIDESAKASDNEIDENNHESSCDYEFKNLGNGNNSLKDKTPQKKVAKKVVKRTKKSEEKEVLQSSVKSNKEETVTSKKVTSTKNKSDVKKSTMKATKASTTDSPKKRSKKLRQKEHAHTDEALTNDEIAKGENLNNNNLGWFSEEAHTEITEKRTLTKEAVNISVSKDNILKKPVKSLGKVKKIKAPAEDVKESKDAKVSDKKKNTEPVKKLAKSESKPLTKKRKAESQLSGDANPEEKQDSRKKKKVTTEKKEKKPTSKAAKPRNSKKKAVTESGESAADQIKKLIEKNIKFDESLNRSFDPSNYSPLDIERVPKKPRRCPSTTSSSSDDDRKFKRRSFHVRVKSKPEVDKSTEACSGDVKKEEKKTVKKIFFAE